MSRCSIPWLFKTSIAEILRGSVGGCRGRGMAHWPCGADGGRKVKAARVAAKRVYTTYGRKTLEGSHGGELRTRNVDAGGDAGAGRVAVLQGRGGDAVRWPRTVLNNHLEWFVLK